MSSSPTRPAWLAPLATAAIFAVAVAAPSACARAVDRGSLGGEDDDGESEITPGSGGAGGIEGYEGKSATHGAGGTPAAGPGGGGDPASSVAASSAASSTSASTAAASVAASSAASVAASSSSGGGPGPCCVPDVFPGCFDDFVIESCVCFFDDYCCAVEWDQQCVDEVEAFGCGSCS
jgi:hypothetical protein